MKCIQCGKDSTYAVRRGSGGRCGGCKQQFAFEPKLDPLKLTDGLFLKIISNVSGDGKLYFTEKQLWYEFNRKAAKKRLASCGASSILWIIALPAVYHALGARHLLMIVACMALALAAAAAAKPTPKPTKPVYAPVSLAAFQTNYLAKWIAAHGRLERMIVDPVRSKTVASFGRTEDITAFSFDRVLVTQTADTAAMLVSNNFHFENNCAILSLDGYPYDRFDTVYQMLGRNPSLMVFALHDASYAGAGMGSALRDARWFPDPAIRIIDLGLRPIHAQKANMILLRVTPDQNGAITRSSLTAPELAWLAEGNVAEVANVRPEKLMRSLYQGFARAGQVGADGSSVYDDTGMIIWMYDPGMDIYATDSFG